MNQQDNDAKNMERACRATKIILGKDFNFVIVAVINAADDPGQSYMSIGSTPGSKESVLWALKSAITQIESGADPIHFQ